MRRQPPSPDISRNPQIAGQTVVEVIYSPSNLVRGIITVDAHGVYRIRTEFWDTRDWDVAGAAFWAQAHLGTFTDTVENARTLCRERMLETVAPVD